MTRLSRIAYVATVALTILAAVAAFLEARSRYGIVAAEMGPMDPSVVRLDVVMLSLLDTPILLSLVALALMLRSGAAIWLAGWAAFDPIVSILGASLVVNEVAPVLAAALPILMGLILVAALLAYLVRSGELRRP